MIVYTGFCLGIGQWFKKRAAEGVDAFYVAKREIPGWAISLAFFSTFISTNTYIGQAGFSFQAGLSWAWVGVLLGGFLHDLLAPPGSEDEGADGQAELRHNPRLF